MIRKRRRQQSRKDSLGQAQAWERFRELQALAAAQDLAVVMFKDYPMHIRIFGEKIVDYWPATRNTWIYGRSYSEKPIEPDGVVRIVMGLPPELKAGSQCELFGSL